MEKYNDAIEIDKKGQSLKTDLDNIKQEVNVKLEKIKKLGDLEYDEDCDYCMKNPFTLDAIETKKSIDENNTKVHNNELIPNAFKKFQPSQKQMAEEIHGVILAVSNFQLWADEMREIRRNEMEQLLLDKKK